MLQPILWGFNFITGSIIAMLVRTGINMLRSRGIMTRQYQNSYLLTRISGLAFDLMIVAGIAAIDIADLRNLCLLLMAVRWHCYLLFCALAVPQTVSRFVEESFVYVWHADRHHPGILLLRQLDPNSTPRLEIRWWQRNGHPVWCPLLFIAIVLNRR